MNTCPCLAISIFDGPITRARLAKPTARRVGQAARDGRERLRRHVHPKMLPVAPISCGMSDFMTEEMRQAKADGISCIVDGGHADMGRDLSFLKTISQKIWPSDRGRRRVLCTGFLSERDIYLE